MNSWKYKVNISSIFHNDDLDLEQKAQAISEQIKKNRWFLDKDDYEAEELSGLLEELVDVSQDEDIGEWNFIWSSIYDIADYDRAWVTTS